MDSSASNHLAYGSPEAVSFYASYAESAPAESQLFGAFDDRLRGRVLDLGIGGGRTTELLASRAQRYVGIDYVPALVEAARARCPGTDVRVGDARDLGEFDDGTFDAVIFSFNGLDYVPHEDRKTVLAEVRRVLTQNGVFVFSTHNLDCHDPVRGPRLPRPRLARRWLGQVRRYLRRRRSHRQMSRHQEYGDGWALLNDEGHDYQLLTHYISRELQEADLREAGFEPLLCLAEDGRPADDGAWSSNSLHYAAVPAA